MTLTEARLAVENVEAARGRVLALGVKLTRDRHREDDLFYDLQDGRLAGAGRSLCLAVTGRSARLTLTEAPRPARSFEVRSGCAVSVLGAAEARRILKAAGLETVFACRLFRTTFRYKDKLTVSLDETPAGAFLELKGERHEIVRFAEILGRSRSDLIKKDYAELIREKEART